MRMRRRLPSLSRRMPILLLLVLGGCTTGYHPQGVLGDGFSEEKLGPDRWIVRFAASSFTPRERLETFLLYRCAEIALENDSRYFVLFRPTDAPKTVAQPPPALLDSPRWAAAPPSRRTATSREDTVLLQLFGPRKPRGYPTAYETRELIRRLSPTIRPG